MQVLTGAATPVLENLADVTGHEGVYDWGDRADVDASNRLAYLILCACGGTDAARMYETYAEQVVRGQLQSGRAWLLLASDVQLWIFHNRKPS
jgi:hypothetical protein